MVHLDGGTNVTVVHRWPRTFADTGELVATLDVAASPGASWASARLVQYGPPGPVSIVETDWEALAQEDWATHTLTATLHPAAEVVALELRTGGAEMDTRSWSVTLGDTPLQELPEARTPGPVGPRDTSEGTGVVPRTLTPDASAELARLIRVWGFLEYRHPAMLAGEVDYDGMLLDALVQLQEGVPVAQVLSDWQQRLPADPAREPLVLSEFSLGPVGTGWLEALPEPTRGWLQAVHTYRGSLEGGVPAQTNGHWTTFPNQTAHREGDTASDPGLRVLGLARYWTVLADFNVYRDLLPDWDAALHDLLPVALSGDTDQAGYELVMHTLAARAHDGHAQFFNDFDTILPVGSCRVDATFRILDGLPVVATSAVPALRPGDQLLRLGEVELADAVSTWTPVHPGATTAGKQESLAMRVSHGDCGPVSAVVLRGRRRLDLTLERVEGLGVEAAPACRPGDPIQIERDVAYVCLGVVRDPVEIFTAIQGTRGVVFDTRAYPGTHWRSLYGHLIRAPHRTHLGAHADPLQPGGLVWNPESLTFVEPVKPYYGGLVAVLTDARSFSRGEATTLILRALPTPARTFGEPTSGTDGAMTRVLIPGMHEGSFTHNIIWPLGTGHVQQRGFTPDVLVQPTARDLARGTDPAYDAAARWVRSTPPDELR
ncbi:MAG: hypothetical protein KC621_02325 [Myxococcales bacterium]|nr:hypothetical protein [Myxococcales bacterium]